MLKSNKSRRKAATHLAKRVSTKSQLSPII